MGHAVGREKKSLRPVEVAMIIIKESDYLDYNVGNIDQVPMVAGVYAFFGGDKSWLYVGAAGADRLRHSIREHWRAGEWPDVYYFRWFQADDEDTARRTEREWIRRHNPKYNGS